MSGLQDEYPALVVAANVDATTPQAKEVVADLGFKNHGLAIRGAGGEVLFTQPDHEVDIDDVRAALSDLLKR